MRNLLLTLHRTYQIFIAIGQPKSSIDLGLYLGSQLLFYWLWNCRRLQDCTSVPQVPGPRHPLSFLGTQKTFKLPRNFTLMADSWLGMVSLKECVYLSRYHLAHGPEPLRRRPRCCYQHVRSRTAKQPNRFIRVCNYWDGANRLATCLNINDKTYPRP